MRLGERILLALSRDPGTADYAAAVPAWTLDNALEMLERQFPGFRDIIAGRRVLDFGCGGGWQTVAMAAAGASHVLGLDINPATLASARALADRIGISRERVDFAERLSAEELASFDVVISQNSMEHFEDPDGILRLMRSALRPGGKMLITFGPPWYAPSGSHMHFFTSVPWVNLLFSEETVMRVRARFRGDGATRYEEVESGLNRMSVAKFERTIRRSGMQVLYRDYHCVKGINVLARLPGVRELFINKITCVLSPAAVPAERGAALTHASV